MQGFLFLQVDRRATTAFLLLEAEAPSHPSRIPIELAWETLFTFSGSAIASPEQLLGLSQHLWDEENGFMSMSRFCSCGVENGARRCQLSSSAALSRL